MTAKRAPDFSLAEAARDPGFSPRRSDAPGLVELVAACGERADDAERSLLRLGEDAAKAAIEHASKADAKGRARLVAVVGRVAAEREADELTTFLMGALADEDPRVRRTAANALGKARGKDAGPALAARLAGEEDASVRRAIASSLGKTGGEEALSALQSIDAEGDELLAKKTAKATIMARRTAERVVPSSFLLDKPTPSPLSVVLHCRAGLGSILQKELPPEFRPRVPPYARNEDRVIAALIGPPARLFQARTMLTFGFPLQSESIVDGDVVGALTRALTSTEARQLFELFTAGPIRFRIAWASGGKRRASTWRAAEEITKAWPALVNDPTDSTWEAVVTERQDGAALFVELRPRAEDPRFFYRTGDVPAASHPTIAAALVRVAGVRPDDIVWDPFVGSGTELCERALAGPYARLIGSDRDEAALDVARKNLEAAGVTDAVLVAGDARSFVPQGLRPTLVLTNPPMGRRVLRGTELEPFFDRFLANIARVVAPGGRIAWISPLPAHSARVARELGLRRELATRIDMGGFDAELELLSVPADHAPPRGPRAFRRSIRR